MSEGFGSEGLLPAPPGVTPNFVDPPTQSGHLIVASIVCPVLAAIFVAARCASKALAGSWGWDDVTSFIGLAFSISLSVLSIIPAQHYGEGRHGWDVLAIWLVPFLKYTYAQTLVYVIGLYFVKLSLLILLYRLFGINRHFRWALYFVLVLWTLYSFIDTVIIVFQCIPVHKAWDPLEKGHCLDLVKLGVASGYINMLIDCLILILPIRMVWSLHLPPKMRLAILGVFATGLFVICTTIVRQVEVQTTLGDTDFTWFSCNSLMWLVIEINVSIICSCMPTLKPLLRKTIWRGESKTPQNYNYNYRSRSKGKISSRSNGESMMDASYIELGPSGTGRDVHIAAGVQQQPRLDHGKMRTDTVGQAVYYQGRDDVV